MTRKPRARRSLVESVVTSWPLEANAAGLDFGEPGKRAHQRALAVAFDSRHADDFARSDCEADLVERRSLRIGAG